MYTEVVIDLMFLCCFLFFCFNDPAPTEIYTYGHTLPYTTLFRSLDRLPARIDALAAEAAALEQRLADPALYKKNPAGFDEITRTRSEEHTSELQSLMRISYAVFCLKKKIESSYRHIDHMHTTPNRRHHTQLSVYKIQKHTIK